MVLAAGVSRRFGEDKRRARLPSGLSLLEASLAVYLRTLGHCIVVVDRCDRSLGAELKAQGATLVSLEGVRSGRLNAGMGDSLAVGVSRLAADGYGAGLIALGDMPLVKPQTIESLVAELDQHPIVAPVCQGRRGHPVGFQARFYPELRELRGDLGARAVLRRHASLLGELAVDDSGVLLDVDSPDDLRDLARCWPQ